MGTPFDFLRAEFPEVHEAAIKACVAALGDARASCFYARVAVELSVKWAFEHDRRCRSRSTRASTRCRASRCSTLRCVTRCSGCEGHHPVVESGSRAVSVRWQTERGLTEGGAHDGNTYL
jgi:hypothetical protein